MSQGTGPPVLSLRWFQSVGAFVILSSSRLCSNPMVHHRLLTASKVLFSSDLDKPKGPEALQPGFPKSPVHEGTLRAQYPIAPSINFGRHLWRNSLPLESPKKPSLLLSSSREHSDLKTRCAVLPADLPRESPDPSFCLCLPGGPGLPGELGAAHHRVGARGSLHLLPKAAAAPDDRAEQQGGGQWVQRQ